MSRHNIQSITVFTCSLGTRPYMPYSHIWSGPQTNLPVCYYLYMYIGGDDIRTINLFKSIVHPKTSVQCVCVCGGGGGGGECNVVQGYLCIEICVLSWGDCIHLSMQAKGTWGWVLYLGDLVSWDKTSGAPEGDSCS